jgi:hypothetical protein
MYKKIFERKKERSEGKNIKKRKRGKQNKL